ncbi:hypothetical protein [Micromonospora thermarum]|uniref:Minor tail protein n=1 Tax=Micromonospora thermarum TaxID=2720024 RepID=A0ABX0Z8V5_9ACTN|nr:hypothetical protein [Micromonospora thermarum]NJP33684.1 hypothetical protein [Micromonospora thermarum]
MAEILKNVRLYAGGADLTGASNKIDAGAEVEEKDVTTWKSYDAASDKVWKEVQGGTASAKITGSGFWPAGDPLAVDDALFASLGGLSSWSALPKGSAFGDLAWLTNAMEGQYQFLGAQGDIAPWTGSWSSSAPLARGIVAHPPGAARVATGSGTAVQHVAVPAGGELLVALHVLSIAGTAAPTLTVSVESDDAQAMPSPTTRATFTPATALGGQFRRVAGPITDTWYRVTWTISGTNPSFLFLVTLGVVPA